MSDAGAPYRLMARNNAWANETLLSAIPPDVWDRLAPGFFPTLSRTLNHIHEVDLYYLDALEGAGLGRSVYDREDVSSPGELARLQADADARLIAICEGLDADILAEPRRTERPDGTPNETVGALLLHLFQHQIHHRGQAHVQLQNAGVAPPQLDDFHLAHGRVPTAAAYLEG